MDRQIADLLEKQADLTKQPFLQNDITERILERTGGKGLYHKFEIDLSVAQTDKEYEFSGDRLTVENVDDAVTIKLESRKNSPIDLQKIPEIHGPINRFFITNAAGTGTLKLLGGSKGMFEFKKKLEIINQANYIIYKDGSHIVATDGKTGEILKRNTDSSVVIQAAIDKMTAGGVIFIKTGTYSLHTTLAISTSSISLIGSGFTTILASYGETTPITISGASTNVIISDIYFDGSTQTTATVSPETTLIANGIVIEACNEVIIRDNYFYDFGSDCIYGDIPTGHVLIKGNIFTDMRGWHGAIHPHGQHNWDVIGNYFKDLDCGAIRHGRVIADNIIDNVSISASLDKPAILGSDEGSSITGNWLTDCKCAGIEAYTVYCSITGNKIEGFNNTNEGINVISYTGPTEASDCVISGNTINNFSTGIFISGSVDRQFIIVTGNTIVCDGMGFYLGTSSNLIIANNTVRNISGANGDGIRATTCDNCIISNNRFDTCARYGILLLSGATNNLVVGNYLTNCTTTTIQDSDGSNTMINNIGYVTEKGGAAANIADGGTIAHGVIGTPTYALAKGTVAGEIIQITGISGSNLTIAIKTNAGAAGTAQTIYWRAWA